MISPLQSVAFKKFIKYHQANKEFLACAVIGSVVRPEVRNFSDVDCVILTKKSLSHSQIINQALRQFKNNYLGQSKDVLVYRIVNFKVSCFYISQVNFFRYVKKILNANLLEVKSQPWVVGGKIEEVLLGDIKLSRVMFDKTGKFTELKNSLVTYPMSFRSKIMNYLKKDIASKLTLQKKIIRNNFLFNIGLYEIIISIIRYIYAQNMAYLLPLKHIASGIHSAFLPVQHRKTIGKLLNIAKIKNKNKIIDKLENYIN